jgi:hypothetical protein
MRVGGSIYKLIRALEGGGFNSAVLRVSALIGRPLALTLRRNTHTPFDPQRLVEAELFRTGLTWYVEGLLKRAKEFVSHGSELAQADDGRIRQMTKLLAEVQQWNIREAAVALVDFRKRQPELAAAVINEAHTTQLELARCIVMWGEEGRTA